MRLDRELVLHVARDLRLTSSVLGVSAHVHITKGAPESVLDHSVDELLVAELHAVAHAIDIVWRIGHRLLAACNDDLRVASPNRLGGEHYRLEARAADLVDGEGGDGRGESRFQCCLTSRRLPDATLDHVAHDDFVDLIGRNPGALDGGTNCCCTELGGRER